MTVNRKLYHSIEILEEKPDRIFEKRYFENGITLVSTLSIFAGV